MLERLAITLAINFVVRQAAQFGHDLDWNKVEEDAAKRVRSVLPGEWMDNAGVALVVAALEGARKALKEEAALKSLLEKTAAGDWVGAYDLLKVLIVRAWTPTTPTQKLVNEHLLAA
jgi:hypothetical protein